MRRSGPRPRRSAVPILDGNTPRTLRNDWCRRGPLKAETRVRIPLGPPVPAWLGLELVEMLWPLHEALDPPAEQDVAQHVAVRSAIESRPLEGFERPCFFGVERDGQLGGSDRHIGELRHIVRITRERPVDLDGLDLEVHGRALR